MPPRHTPETLALTLARKSERDSNGCLLWRGYVDKRTGYGIIGVDWRLVKVHRAAWVVANGPIPDGLKVCHTCDVRNCIEPTHLWLGTQKENMADARAKGRQHPPAGWNRGIPHSAETRGKIAAKARARPHRKHTAESKAKMAAKAHAMWERRRAT